MEHSCEGVIDMIAADVLSSIGCFKANGAGPLLLRVKEAGRIADRQ